MEQRSILFAFVYLLPSLCNGCFQWYQKMQTCVNCKPATECRTVTAETVTSTAAECKYSCFIGGTICDMAYRQHDSCIMFSKFHCNGVVEDAGEIVFRRTCISDCLEYNISSWSQKAGTCATLNGTSGFNHTRISCLTLCIDAKECRGSTYWIQSGKCELHTCDSMTDSDNTYFTSRTCFDGPSSSRPVTIPKYPTSLSEKSLLLSSGIINATLYFELTGETGLPSVTPGPTTPPQLTIVSIKNNVTESASSSALNLTTETTSSYSSHETEGFFTKPANIAAMSITGGAATAGILTAAACKKNEEKIGGAKRLKLLILNEVYDIKCTVELSINML